MSIQLDYPHIECPPDSTARLVRIPRVRVAQIAMDYLNHGWSADEICRQYPHLRPSEVHSAMAWYFDHQAEIHSEIDAELAIASMDREQFGSSILCAKLKARG
jgi:uncharacterized protein (DUF433 family)